MKAALITEEQFQTIKDALESTSTKFRSVNYYKLEQAHEIIKSLKLQEPVGIRYNYFGWTVVAFDEGLLKILDRYPDATPKKLYALGDEND